MSINILILSRWNRSPDRARLSSTVRTRQPRLSGAALPFLAPDRPADSPFYSRDSIRVCGAIKYPCLRSIDNIGPAHACMQRLLIQIAKLRIHFSHPSDLSVCGELVGIIALFSYFAAWTVRRSLVSWERPTDRPTDLPVAKLSKEQRLLVILLVFHLHGNVVGNCF